jgi:peptide subunit release factor 1 (eRF1)
VPFPPLTGDLVEHVLRDRRIGVLLVRRGGYAAGMFDGKRLVTSKVGSSYVQGTTKAGGWSQQRYARRRANQANAAFADAADAAARVLDGQHLDALVAGGDREAVKAVLADRRLAGLEPIGPWLTVKDPKLRILATMPEQFRTVRIRLDP